MQGACRIPRRCTDRRRGNRYYQAMFSDREDPDYANIIEQAVNYSLDNDMVREFDAIEQQKKANSTHR